MFPNEPQLSQYLDYPRVRENDRNAVGDIRQHWIDIGDTLGISAFTAKTLFVLGIMRRYVLSANSVLKEIRHLGFLSAYSLLSSGVEVLGRCIHADIAVRQNPVSRSTNRLIAGFEFSRRQHLPAGTVVETNHFNQSGGGYNSQELTNMRNLATHGGCITQSLQIKGDIELLHELRKAFYGIPVGENDPHQGPGPFMGALDRYYELLATGDNVFCERLATAGISPSPLRLQNDGWSFDNQIISEIQQHIISNLSQDRFPISGGHSKADDYFQLYP
jgi:hypothetical protein